MSGIELASVVDDLLVVASGEVIQSLLRSSLLTVEFDVNTDPTAGIKLAIQGSTTISNLRNERTPVIMSVQVWDTNNLYTRHNSIH